MLEHVAIAAVIAVRSLTTVGAVDGRDMDIKVVVSHRAVVLGDKADSVPMVVFSVASRVIVGMSVLFIPSKDHLSSGGTHSQSGSASFQSPLREIQSRQSGFTTTHQTQQQYQHQYRPQASSYQGYTLGY